GTAGGGVRRRLVFHEECRGRDRVRLGGRAAGEVGVAGVGGGDGLSAGVIDGELAAPLHHSGAAAAPAGRGDADVTRRGAGAARHLEPDGDELARRRRIVLVRRDARGGGGPLDGDGRLLRERHAAGHRGQRPGARGGRAEVELDHPVLVCVGRGGRDRVAGAGGGEAHGHAFQ